MFITFEGPDGAGKSTQAALLVDVLREHGLKAILTREPGGTELGNRLRSILLDERQAVSPEAEAYLMTGARAEHVRQVIRPAIQDGTVVVCDRFVDSTLAYQGAGRGLDEEKLLHMQDLAVDGCWPDATILLDIDAEASVVRNVDPEDRNRLDDEPMDFHRRVVAWYRQAAQRDSNRWHVVDASRTVDFVANEVQSVVLTLLKCPDREPPQDAHQREAGR